MISYLDSLNVLGKLEKGKLRGKSIRKLKREARKQIERDLAGRRFNFALTTGN